MLDLERDAWSMGTPIRVLVEDEAAKLSLARDKARAQAEPALMRAGITEPAMTLAANYATEVNGDRNRLEFSRWYVPLGAGEQLSSSTFEIRHELRLEQLERAAPDGCTPEDGPYYGIRLTLKDVKLQTAHSFYEDKAIPASRRCPLAYDLTAVVAPSGVPETDRLVAIIGVYSRGFEGADQRFIAVPFTLSD